MAAELIFLILCVLINELNLNKKRVLMKKSSIIRFGGGAALLGGLFLSVFVAFFYHSGTWVLEVMEPRMILISAVCHLGFYAGIYALYRVQSEPRSGKVGTFVGLTGVLVYLIGGLASGAVLGWTTNLFPDVAQRPDWPIYVSGTGFLLFYLGSLLVGVETLIRRKFKTWTGSLLILAPVIAVQTLITRYRVMWIALGLIGILIAVAVLTDRSAPEQAPAFESGEEAA
jgi:hypothetical protein